MDKQGYKELVADLLRNESALKCLVEEIFTTVEKEPNNMELGKSIRQIYYNTQKEQKD